MNLINTLYPNGKYILSSTHPYWHPKETEVYDKGKEMTLWLSARTRDECDKVLKEMVKSGEYKSIKVYPCGYRPAKGFPIPEFTYEVLLNNENPFTLFYRVIL